MKGKEKYTIEQVLDMIDMIRDGMNTELECVKCPCDDYCTDMTGIDIFKSWLGQEVQTNKTAKGDDKAVHPFFDRSNMIDDFATWLCEEVEVEE